MVDPDVTYYNGVVLFDETEHDPPPEYTTPASDTTFPEDKKAAPPADNSL